MGRNRRGGTVNDWIDRAGVEERIIMGLSSAASSFFSGDFKTAADYLFIPEEDIMQGNDIDKRIADFNSTQDPYHQIQNTPFQEVVAQNSPADAFTQSYRDQLSSVSGAISGATGSVLWETIKAMRYFILIASIIGIGYLWILSKERKLA